MFSRSTASNGGGSGLLRALIDDARGIGYRELKLDTLEWMTAARDLYTAARLSRMRAVLSQPASRRGLHGVLVVTRTGA